MLLNEFLVDLDILYNDKGIAKAITDVAKLSAGFLAVNKMFESYNAKFSTLSKNMSMLGGTMQGVQRWMNVAGTSAFTTTEKVQSALEELTNKLIDIQHTGQIPLGFQMLGIDGLDGIENTLEKIRNNIATMPATKVKFALQEAGLADLMPLLKMSKQEFNDKTGTILSDQHIKKIHEATAELRTLKTNFILLKDYAVASISPVFADLAHIVNDYLKMSFQLLVPVITRIGYMFGNLSSLLRSFTTSNIGKLTIAITATTLAFTKFNAILNGAKWVLNGLVKHPIIATISLLALTVEDFVQYLAGNKSVIGVFFEKFQNVAAVKFLQSLIESTRGFFNDVKNFFMWLESALDNLSFEKIGTAIGKITTLFTTLFKPVHDVLDPWIDRFNATFVRKPEMNGISGQGIPLLQQQPSPLQQKVAMFNIMPTGANSITSDYTDDNSHYYNEDYYSNTTNNDYNNSYDNNTYNRNSYYSSTYKNYNNNYSNSYDSHDNTSNSKHNNNVVINITNKASSDNSKMTKADIQNVLSKMFTNQITNI